MKQKPKTYFREILEVNSAGKVSLDFSFNPLKARYQVLHCCYVVLSSHSNQHLHQACLRLLLQMIGMVHGSTVQK